jgi:hypothetical protein
MPIHAARLLTIFFNNALVESLLKYIHWYGRVWKCGKGDWPLDG